MPLKPAYKSKTKVIFIPKQSLLIQRKTPIVKAQPVGNQEQKKRFWWFLLSIEFLFIPFLFVLGLNISTVTLMWVFIAYISILGLTVMKIGQLLELKKQRTKQELLFSPSKVLDFSYNGYRKEETWLESPFLFDLIVEHKGEGAKLTLKNFGEKVIDFELDNIQLLPQITDGICKLYKVEYFYGEPLGNNKEHFIFHSNDSFVSSKLLRMKDKKLLEIDIFDYPKYSMTFDWDKQTLTVINQTENNERLIPISNLREIRVDLFRKSGRKGIFINRMNIRLWTKNRRQYIQLANFELDDNLAIKPIFHTTHEFVKMLKSKSQLEDVLISIKC